LLHNHVSGRQRRRLCLSIGFPPDHCLLKTRAFALPSPISLTSMSRHLRQSHCRTVSLQETQPDQTYQMHIAHGVCRRRSYTNCRHMHFIASVCCVNFWNQLINLPEKKQDGEKARCCIPWRNNGRLSSEEVCHEARNTRTLRAYWLLLPLERRNVSWWGVG